MWLIQKIINWAVELNGYTDIIAPAAEVDTEWKASFSFKELEAAAKEAGQTVAVKAGTDIAIGEKGKSGRAMTITIGGKPIEAAKLRIALGSTKMRSTLLTGLQVSGNNVVMEGKGYGHGVGMSQWGAYQMAEQGKKAEDIVMHYFQNVKLVKLW